MIDLNDVLLAMSNIPVDDPIAEIWGRGLQGGDKIIEYTSSLPITINADGDALLDYRIYGNTVQNGTPTPENPIVPSECGVRTENLLNIEPGMLDEANWTTAARYFMYYLLSEDTAERLKRIGTIAGTVYLIAGGSHYTGEALAITSSMKEFGVTITERLLHSDGTQLQYSADVSGYSNVYLGIGYGSGITPSNKQILIDAIFDNYNIMLNAGTVPLPYEPYGYKLPMMVKSANLFDKSSPDIIMGKGFYSDTFSMLSYNNRFLSGYIKVKPNTTYICNSTFLVRIYTSDDGSISSRSRIVDSGVFKTNSDENFIMLDEFQTNINTLLLQELLEIPVYIGENKLDAIWEYRDYVDFGIQKIARKIREYTFTGNETFNLFAQNAYGTCWVNLRLYTTIAYCPIGQITLRSSHFMAINNSYADFWYGYPQLDDACNFEKEDGYDTVKIFFRSTANFSTAEECKAYFKEQYDNGTPVKIWFVMKYTVGQYESTDIGKEDPPVPFPEIPTIDGTTIIDYDGTPKPSQMYVKYRGKE